MASSSALQPVLQWTEKPKQRRSPTVSQEEWTRHRQEIFQLHRFMKLDDLRTHMKKEYDFTPSRHQFVTQFQKWGLQKYKTKNPSASSQAANHSDTTSASSPIPFESSVGTNSEGILPSNPEDPDISTYEAEIPSFGIEIPRAVDAELVPHDANFKSLNTLGSEERLNLMSLDLFEGQVLGSGIDILWPDTQISIEDQIAELFKCFEQEQGVDSGLVQGPVITREGADDTTTRASQEFASPGTLVMTSSRRSSVLKRVPHVQKRRRSASSGHASFDLTKRVKGVHDFDQTDASGSGNDHLMQDAPSFMEASGSLPGLMQMDVMALDSQVDWDSTQATPETGGTPETNQTPGSPSVPSALSALEVPLPTASQSDDGFDVTSFISDSHMGAAVNGPLSLRKKKGSEIGGTPIQNSPLTKLFDIAHKGGSLGHNDHRRLDTVQKLAGFFFGAGLYSEAFLLYLLTYKTLKRAPETTKDLLFPAVINLARCSITESQDCIVRALLLEASRKRHWGRAGEPHENFLLHAFLTIVSRRQNNMTKADHHCHRAIQCFEGPTATKNPLTNQWRSLSVVAWTHLGFNLTEKRLLLTRSEPISTNVRRRVCSRASDQLIMVFDSFWATEKEFSEKTCMMRGSEIHFSGSYGHDKSQSPALRALFEWCLQALEKTPTDFDSRQPWQKFRAEGMKLRSIGLTTLYCQLWNCWEAEGAENPLVSTSSDFWRIDIEDELGIGANECLATIPDALAVAWPFDDEDMPMLANWRTYQAELCRRATTGLRLLLNEPDRKLAHVFFEAYSGRCIAQRLTPTAEMRSRTQLRRECILTFATEHIDLRELAVNRSVSQLSSVREDQELSLKEMATEIPPEPHETDVHMLGDSSPTLANSNDRAPQTQRQGPASTSSLPQHHSSTTSRGTVSTDLASMESLRRRLQETRTSNYPNGRPPDLKPPSSAIQDRTDFDMVSLENIMGLARTSMESLSLSGSGSGGGSLDSESRRLLDVMVG